MSLLDFTKKTPGFTALGHAQKIKLLAWFLHEHRDVADFKVADIRACYNELHLDLPGNLASSIEALATKKPPDLLKRSAGYRLHANIREGFSKRFSIPQSTIVVEKALAELPGLISKEGERQFMQETLICYRNGAFRASIVMAWNLAYDHLLNWVLSDSARLNGFNLGIGKRCPKKSLVITSREDFEELKEDEVIDIASGLPGVTSNMKKLLKEKLGRRNTYAHPSTLVVSKPQVDDMITDLVQNIVIRLPL